MSNTLTPAAASRGPAEHSVRDQIMEAANECFARYGYAKTTVADLAREIGFSKAYIYRFFESKQAIGEAICKSRLDSIIAAARAAVASGGSSSDKLRQLFKILTAKSVELFFHDRKIYDITVHSAAERWSSGIAYQKELLEMVEAIVRDGREGGEFERKTPLDETCRAIFYAMSPFVNPLHLERNLDALPDCQVELANLILRSLSA